ncbi:MAG: helix-turn-helix domain-containing protein [Pseudomonadota bacterium]
MALVPAMARDRKTARMQEQIKVLLNQGLSIRKVALALGISRQTVRKFGMDQPADVSGAGAATSESASDAAIDWQDVAKQARSTRDERGDFIPESVLVRGHTR